MNIEILYEDDNTIAINKPSGLMVHSASGGVHGDGKSNLPRQGRGEITLADWIIENYPDIKEVGEPWEKDGNKIYRPGIVHRLDRETSGVMVIAKTKEMFDHLKQQFQNREVKKVYRAVVWGNIKEDEGVIDAPIGKSKKDFRQRSAQRGARGVLREAVTEFKVLERFESEGEKFTYIEIYPKTGRTHQIRVHMKYRNNPVVCDTLYAGKRPCALGLDRLALHAYSLELKKLDGESLCVEVPLPEDFEKSLQIK